VLPQGPSPAAVNSTAAIACQLPRQTARASQDGSAAAEARSGSAAGAPALAVSTASPVSPSTLDLLNPTLAVTRADDTALRYPCRSSLCSVPSGRSEHKRHPEVKSGEATGSEEENLDLVWFYAGVARKP
jgi:hypothetical protein